MRETTKSLGRRLLSPLVSLLVRLRVPANAITLAALPLSMVAAWLFATGRFTLAGAVQALAGVCDSLDGEVSRRTGSASPAGALFDSVVDRLNEGLVLTGIIWYYAPRNVWSAMTAVAALFFSLMVSYVRARAEGVGRECKVGFFERPVRVFVLVAGAFLLGRTYLPWALGLVALGGLVTTIHRFVHGLQRPGGQA
jgi:CDP-diacylglycerol--glycerol-3-phosphate 3-phosphatidyltransferase